MCQYSLETYENRLARNGEILKLQKFESGTKGFVSPDNRDVAVCLTPSTTMLVVSPIKYPGERLVPGTKATFVKSADPDAPAGKKYHTDCLHFAGAPEPILLQYLPEGLVMEVVEVAADQSVESPKETGELVAAD
jgi:hypothetical protein